MSDAVVPAPLWTGRLGPTAHARLTQVQLARQQLAQQVREVTERLDREASEVLAINAEGEGHAFEAGTVRFRFDLTTRSYEAHPAGRPAENGAAPRPDGAAVPGG